MANWLHDSQASQAAGKHIFKMPYPGGTWIEEKRKNAWLIFLMEMAWKAAALGFKSKKGGKLTDDEEKLLDEIAEYQALRDTDGTET